MRLTATPRPCTLPAERQLSPRALRQVEVERRAAQLAANAASSSTSASPEVAGSTMPVRVPAAGRQRARWLKARLMQFLEEDTQSCAALAGSTAEVLLAHFERRTGEAYTDSPGASVTSRVRSLAKVMGNITREGTFDPPLLSATWNQYRVWSRVPTVPFDVEWWRCEEEAREAEVTPAARLRTDMAGVDAELMTWLRSTLFLKAVEVEAGETSMGLLILWEVEHRRPFPAGVDGDNRTATVASFCRRLRARVSQDDNLRGWLQVKEMQCVLQPGTPAVHQMRWSVQVVSPASGDPGGVYEEFVARWRSYVTGLLTPATTPPPPALPRGRPAEEDPEERTAKRKRTAPPARQPAPTAGRPQPGRQRARSPTSPAPREPKRRCTDLRGWLQPRSTSTDETLSGHGRATTGSTP